jgi:hypothetical protein
MNKYIPKPIDTSEVMLSDDLLELTERLAENTHEIWAKQRIADGWTWGPQRDDGKKKHPCLIPYPDLLESEKEYDRITAMETLKVIMLLGYDVERKGEPNK